MQLFSRKTKRGSYWYCYVKCPPGSRRARRQLATHIRDSGPKSRQAAEEVGWQLQALELNGGGLEGRRKIKRLGEALEALAKARELDECSYETLRVTKFRGNRLVEWFGFDRDLGEITTEVLVDYATEAKKSRAATTVAGELSLLGAAMRAVGVTPPKMPKLGDTSPKPQRVLEVDEMKAFILALSPRHKLIGWAYLQMGLRTSELAKIPTDKIDWKRRVLWCDGTKTQGSARWIPIPDELFAEMKALKDAGQWRGFPKLHRVTIDQLIRRAGRRIGIEFLSVNDLRGTYATHMARANVPAHKRAAYMGNSAEMQEKTYAQVGLVNESMRDDVTRGVPRLRGPSIAGASSNSTATANPTVAEAKNRRND